MRNIIKLFIVIPCLHMLGGCKLLGEDNLAPIEYRGDKFYGFSESQPDSYDENTYTKLPQEDDIQESRNVNLSDNYKPGLGASNARVSESNQKQEVNTEGYKNASKWKRYYIVKSGDTLAGIASKYSLSMSDIARLNELKPPYKLKPGDKLLVRVQQPQVKENTAAAAKRTPSGKNTQTVSGKNQQSPGQKKSKQKTEDKSRKTHFIYPVGGKIISYFGKDKDFGVKNDGLNFSAPKGTKVRASQGGKIVYVGNELKGYGNLVIIRHDKNLLTAYAHLADLLPEKGEIVKQGQVIGHVGNSGYVKNAQLHFAIRYNNQPADPLKFLTSQNFDPSGAK